MERYDLVKQQKLWQQLDWSFISKLRNINELAVYHEKCQGNGTMIYANRQRINYPEAQYQRLFLDIFKDAERRKLILFGSGAYARRLLALYGKEYPVAAIVDNNPVKWGTVLEGIKILSPDILRTLSPGEYKVIVCIKAYLPILRQLEGMGITEYSIFDVERDYPKKKTAIELHQEFATVKTPKKYHVGYISGVFDLFHIGHLNMFKRAKEQCDYLIVGVVRDEWVTCYKKTKTFIPFDERIEMVRSCRYVDQAEAIPLEYPGTRDAWRMYHFDVQFSGSDYVDDPSWLADKEFLEKRGAELVFFPYTEQTSSTKIKALISQHLV